jgi:GNAT superfamily N-acetyltransferase
LIDLKKPKIKRNMDLGEDTLRQYRKIAAMGHSFGAYMNEICVGVALTQIHAWNASLWVQELHLHIAPKYQGQGIGHLLQSPVKEAKADMDKHAGNREVNQGGG